MPPPKVREPYLHTPRMLAGESTVVIMIQRCTIFS
jgi:hypothetical protein